MKKIFTILFFTGCTLTASAQTQHSFSIKEYARKPLWINMMDDTLANFYQVELAYNTYFQHHEKPEGEAEEINENREREKHLSKRKLRKMDAENALRMNVKHYEVWHYQTLPYVLDDGRIMTPFERLAIWKAQNGDKN